MPHQKDCGGDVAPLTRMDEYLKEVSRRASEFDPGVYLRELVRANNRRGFYGLAGSVFVVAIPAFLFLLPVVFLIMVIVGPLTRLANLDGVPITLRVGLRLACLPYVLLVGGTLATLKLIEFIGSEIKVPDRAL